MIYVTVVKELPKRKGLGHTQKEMDAILNAFMNREESYGKIGGWESLYKNRAVAQNCLYNAAKRRGLPLKVRAIGDELFFIRTDM